MEKNNNQIRKVNYTSLHVGQSKDNLKDSTSNLFTFLYGKLTEVTESGIPEIVKLNIIKNNNTQVTEANGLVEIELPLIPATYNSIQFNSTNHRKNNQSLPEIAKKCSLDFETLHYDFFKEGMPEIATARYEKNLENPKLKELTEAILKQRAEALVSYVCTKIKQKQNQISKKAQILNGSGKPTFIHKFENKEDEKNYSILENLECMKDKRNNPELKFLSSEETAYIDQLRATVLRYECNMSKSQLGDE